eukprot:CAMPEP_0170565804 /NCGR_PEP_ID=MMETSP0211-20121228/79421_1 /TAXON_ID=311385 /ORGANISM="Pseudokeronopsis sp., Strain OXSARD2" /LENGTH=97 /DNA_ID=CAMNT_0010886777 /DNA_START=1034 /DNA_END=1327 /DNA_ORIENTATION=-
MKNLESVVKVMESNKPFSERLFESYNWLNRPLSEKENLSPPLKVSPNTSSLKDKKLNFDGTPMELDEENVAIPPRNTGLVPKESELDDFDEMISQLH